MNVPWFIFFTLLVMCALLGIAFVTPQVPSDDVTLEDGSTERVVLSHGFEHDIFPSMEQGGPGAERHANTLWIAWAFAVVSIVFYVACLLLGAGRHGKLGPTKVPFAVGTVIFIGIFTAMFLSYRTFSTQETYELFLGFPKPTAWMIYAVWPFPISFLILYYVTFDKWHFTDEDEQRLEELIANHSQSTSEEH